MQVFVTLDKIDGSQSRLKGPVYLDEIDLHGLLFFLNQADVAGVSFVRADILTRIGPDGLQKERLTKPTGGAGG